MPRTPVCASLVAQCAPTRLAHCDPGAGIGYRIAFYGEGTWEQIDTAFPVMTHEEARALIEGAAACLAAHPALRQAQSLEHKDAA